MYHERISYYAQEVGGNRPAMVVVERYITPQENPKYYINPKGQAEAPIKTITGPSRRTHELDVERKKQGISKLEKALAEEKQKMAKLQHEKAKLKQHKILDEKLENLRYQVKKAKLKNQVAEAQLKDEMQHKKATLKSGKARV